jgi:hypothetical protein
VGRARAAFPSTVTTWRDIKMELLANPRGRADEGLDDQDAIWPAMSATTRTKVSVKDARAPTVKRRRSAKIIPVQTSRVI